MSTEQVVPKGSVYRRTVLITGCSDGGLGASLARCLHSSGLRVFATTRNLEKMALLKSLGIETFQLDVLDGSSISSCVRIISEMTDGRLDILINNAGGGYFAPFSDVNIQAAMELFDLNVWSLVRITQAFLPMLMKSGKENGNPIIANHTSIASVMHKPYSSVYQASKAAAAMFNDHMRLEFEPFGIKVVDLKSGGVHSNFHTNRLTATAGKPTLREGSIYTPVKNETERAMGFSMNRANQDVWSREVVKELLRETPRPQIWKGKGVWIAWWQRAIQGFLPTQYDSYWKRVTGLELLKTRLEEAKKG